jgi:hypothetical protein
MHAREIRLTGSYFFAVVTTYDLAFLEKIVSFAPRRQVQEMLLCFSSCSNTLELATHAGGWKRHFAGGVLKNADSVSCLDLLPAIRR